MKVPNDMSITLDLTGYAQLQPEYSCITSAVLKPTAAYFSPRIDVVACATEIGARNGGSCTDALCSMNAQSAINSSSSMSIILFLWCKPAGWPYSP